MPTVRLSTLFLSLLIKRNNILLALLSCKINIFFNKNVYISVAFTVICDSVGGPTSDNFNAKLPVISLPKIILRDVYI